METKKRIVVVGNVSDLNKFDLGKELVIVASPSVPEIDLPNRAARRGNKARIKRRYKNKGQ